VHIIEDGDVLTEVESFFWYGASFVRISYKMYKDMPYTDVKADVFWNEQQKALKLKIPAAFDGTFIGQIPFATDEFQKDGKEVPAHRFAGFRDGDAALTLYNNCTYGFCAEGNDLYATLLRGAAYCAHPLGVPDIIDPNRFIPTIEQGRHSFSFRLSYDPVEKLENNAQEFVNIPYSLNFFPHGENNLAKPVMKLGNPQLSLAAFYQTEAGYILRVVNNNPVAATTDLQLQDNSYTLSFTPYEVKTLLYADNRLQEQEIWL
jgi:alpha-mannosidase